MFDALLVDMVLLGLAAVAAIGIIAVRSSPPRTLTSAASLP